MKMHDRPIILELEENLSASRDSTTNIRLFASVKGVVQFYAIGRKGFKKSVRFFAGSKTVQAKEEMEKKQTQTKSPYNFTAEIKLYVCFRDLHSSSKVCSIQPLEVYHHATFLVDLEALPSTQDLKCDDVGNWRSNSNDKFYFSVEWMDDNFAQVTAAKSSYPDVVTLKRQYYMLTRRRSISFSLSEIYIFWGTVVVNL